MITKNYIAAQLAEYVDAVVGEHTVEAMTDAYIERWGLVAIDDESVGEQDFADLVIRFAR